MGSGKFEVGRRGEREFMFGEEDDGSGGKFWGRDTDEGEKDRWVERLDLPGELGRVVFVGL